MSHEPFVGSSNMHSLGIFATTTDSTETTIALTTIATIFRPHLRLCSRHFKYIKHLQVMVRRAKSQ